MWRYRHNFTLYLSTEGKKNIGAASRDKASSVCQPVEKWLVHWLLLCRTLQSWVFVCFFRSFIITIFFLHITGPNVANSKFAGHTPIHKLRIELSDTRKMNNILRTSSDQLNASEKKKKKKRVSTKKVVGSLLLRRIQPLKVHHQYSSGCLGLPLYGKTPVALRVAVAAF